MTQRESELERLLEVSALLTSTLDLDSLLTKILESAENLMDAAASNVMLLDRATHELVYQVVLGQAGSQIRNQKRLKVGVGIAGWVAEHNQPLLIEDAYEDPRFFRDFDKKTGFRTKSILCLPLRAKDSLIGVAQIINKRSAAAFTPADQTLFTDFCNIAAVAIDNALLHRQILEQDRLQRDLQLAEEIQEASLPTQTPIISNLRVEFRSTPCRHVGGDVVEITELPDGKLAVLIADVSGKGIPAALFGAKFSTEYQYELKNCKQGGELFTRLNDRVAARSTRGMFITGIHAIFDPKTLTVELVNAGHPFPLIAAPGCKSARLLTTTELPPLGIIPGQVFETTQVKLAANELMILTTDGVTEAKAKDGSRFGVEAAQKALASDPTQGVSRLMKELKQFTSGESPADDVTVVGVQFGQFIERNISTDPSAMAEIRGLLEKQAQHVGFSEKIQGRISLAVTEAIANIIKHTYQMRLDGKIRISITTTPTQLQVHIRDWGPKQDSSRFVSRKLEDIRPGGLGIHYMKQTMTMVEFDDTHRDGNEVYMMIEKSGET